MPQRSNFGQQVQLSPLQLQLYVGRACLWNAVPECATGLEHHLVDAPVVEVVLEDEGAVALGEVELARAVDVQDGVEAHGVAVEVNDRGIARSEPQWTIRRQVSVNATNSHFPECNRYK